MAEITRLKEKAGRVRVYADGEFYAEIDLAVAEESGLVEGFDISEKALREVCRAGEYALAMRRAFNLLSYRARSRGEIRDRLASKHDHKAEIIDSVLVRLEELGYLDDKEFARSVARQKAGKYGPRRIAAELQRAGVSKETVGEVVEEEFSGRDEFEEARKAVHSRYNTEDVGGGDALARKVYGFLARRGYSPEVCAEIAGEYRTGQG
ncbi:regulatory protein RecX [Rubrobacter indicoceani]|uniref:regulatory protein RecX n=1 Tax=Rubrobacter indicoceani TaxID=2051957 RepID=UPI000E5A76DF|nr:regulatory protein RecX [Rubrobacter indicoceani]